MACNHGEEMENIHYSVSDFLPLGLAQIFFLIAYFAHFPPNIALKQIEQSRCFHQGTHKHERLELKNILSKGT